MPTEVETTPVPGPPPVASESTAGDPGAPAATPAEPDPLADALAKLEAQQKINRDLEKKVKGEAGPLRDQIAALQAKIDGTEAQFAQEQAQRKVETEALAKANERILRSEIKAAAKGVLADPSDAALYLDLQSFQVDDNGNVDEDAITRALTELVSKKPHLAVAQGTRFQGSADQGPRGSVKSEEQALTEALAEANAARDFTRAIGIKQRIAALAATKRT